MPLTDAGVVAELERLRSGAADEVRYRARGQAYRATRSGDGFFVQVNEVTKVARLVRAVGFRFWPARKGIMLCRAPWGAHGRMRS